MNTRLRGFQRQRFAVLTALVLIVWTTSGCYTRLNHPSNQFEVAAESSESCSRCHEIRLDDQPDGASWVSYYGYSSSPWLNYYASPWWYESEWVQGRGHGATATGSEPDTRDGEPQGRLTWGRRPLGSGLSPHDNIERTTASAPLIPAPGAPASVGHTVSAPAESNSETKAAEKKKQAKKEKRKAGRAIRR